jgi:sugar phosphate isomerase/epimerase
MTGHNSVSKALFLAVCILWLSIPPANAQRDEFILGVCNHLAHGRSNASQSLQAIEKIGANSFRDDVFWSLVETEKDVFRWPERFRELERAIDLANARGIEPVVILAYENRFHHVGRYPISDEAQAAFTRFAEYVVRRFKGRVRYYEVWNEWNQGGTAKDYVRLLKRVYPAIKRIDANAIVLGGAVEGAGPPKFIRAMMENGALPSMDGLSVHPYVFWRGTAGTPEAMYQWMVDLQKMLHQFSAGRDVPLYITEIGWPTDATSLGISHDQAADYVAQTILMMRSLPYVKGIWLFDTGKDPKDHGSNFGLFTEDAQAKPAAQTFAELNELARKGRFVRRENAPPGVWALRFATPQGQETLAVFNTRNVQVRVRSAAAVPKIELNRIKPRQSASTGNLGDVPLQLGATPVLLNGTKDALNNLKFETTTVSKP